MDLVVYFTDTSSGTLSTEALSRTTGASGFKSPSTTQHSLHLRLGENATVMAVLYPVTRTQATPKFTKLANGRAVKIESSYGTDYAFLDLDPFDFSQGGAVFPRPSRRRPTASRRPPPQPLRQRPGALPRRGCDHCPLTRALRN